MKEPLPDADGFLRWSGVTVANSLIEIMKGRGYRWDEGLACYQLVFPQKETLVPLAPISFEVDAFHRAVHKPYGGDCR